MNNQTLGGSYGSVNFLSSLPTGAEIHELHTEMLNMKEKSEMQSHVAANMCKIEQSVPSRSVESEPENVFNTLSPGRSSRWILPAELETPNRPTSSGLQSTGRRM